ncbi:MAG: fumarylacetoacetate hydrolase family protein [Bdellovibrionota bacterium]
MKLATLRSDKSRDGQLIVVSKDGKKAVQVDSIAKNLREAVENWSGTEGALKEVYKKLNEGAYPGEFTVDQQKLHSPFPRSFQWCDGSAFLHHVRLVRKARGADLPENLLVTPLMYQGGSDTFLAPTDDIPQVDFKHGTDFEGEVVVVTNDVPLGVTAEQALKHIVLVMIANDVSLRGLIPEELAMGFGFLQSKPSSAFAPFALTLDELSGSWREGRLHLPLYVNYNGKFFGKANAGEMHFHFGQLIAHAARTRNLAAGTIIGSGTVSNEDPTVGSSCLAEKRAIEHLNEGTPKTPFMKIGDTIEMWMTDESGHDLFGRISQRVTQA